MRRLLGAIVRTSRRQLLLHSVSTLLVGTLGASARAQSLQYTYDELGRLKTATYPNGMVVTYAYDAAGNRTQVASAFPAPTGTFTATPSSISTGSSSTLSWTSANASSASIDNGVGSVTPVAGGSVSVSPTTTTTYTLTLTGAGGTIYKQATVTVSPPIFSATIAVTGSSPVNLRTLANTAGYNGAMNASVIFQVGSGVTITGAAGAPSGGIAIDSGTWPTGTYSITVALQVSGSVLGGGGAGGAGGGIGDGEQGGLGGDAVYCRLPMSVTVNSGGAIKSGGGGGGGGGAYDISPPFPDPETRGGGGGGGGAPNGPAGAGGMGSIVGGLSGSAGTTGGGGAGAASSGGAGAGGNGGNYGTTGAAGGDGSYTRGNGNVAGYAIRKNGNTVPVTNNGTITGTQG